MARILRWSGVGQLATPEGRNWDRQTELPRLGHERKFIGWRNIKQEGLQAWETARTMQWGPQHLVSR